MKDDKIKSITELGEVLGISRSAASRYAKRGYIPTARLTKRGTKQKHFECKRAAAEAIKPFLTMDRYELVKHISKKIEEDTYSKEDYLQPEMYFIIENNSSGSPEVWSMESDSFHEHLQERIKKDPHIGERVIKDFENFDDVNLKYLGDKVIIIKGKAVKVNVKFAFEVQ
jgi:predicted transcriptional regulator